MKIRVKMNELETNKQKTTQPNRSIKLQAISLSKINKIDKLLVKVNRKKDTKYQYQYGKEGISLSLLHMLIW